MKKHFFRKLFFLIILAIALLIVYGSFLGNTGLIVKEYSINNEKFPSSFKNFKIGHFSDILYNDKNDIERIKEVVKKINEKKLDLVFFTGNLIDENYSLNENEINTISEELKKINAVYGKYYVSSSFDKRTEGYDTIMIKSNFTSLNDSQDSIISKENEIFYIFGIDSSSDLKIVKELNNGKDNFYKIVVFNKSDLIDDIKDLNFSLALSGNSLNGQINIPIIKEFLLPNDSKNYYEPYYIVNNTDYYISSGIGTRKIDFRLFNKPSINIYTINKK